MTKYNISIISIILLLSVTKKCMNGVWKKCAKRYVNTFDGFDNDNELEVIRDKIVKLAKEMSLECETEEVEELLDKKSEELANEDLIELEKEKVAEEERREAAAAAEMPEEEEEEPQRMFTTKGLAEGLSMLNKLITHFEGMDPNIERFARIERMALDAFRPYRENMKKRKNEPFRQNSACL